MADYPPRDDRLRHLIAQEINPHVSSWKLAFFIADGIVTSREVRGELKRIAEAHAAGEHCGDRNCEHCWNATLTGKEVSADVVADRAAQVITTMGADIRALAAQRDRYRKAWRSACTRAVRLRGTSTS